MAALDEDMITEFVDVGIDKATQTDSLDFRLAGEPWQIIKLGAEAWFAHHISYIFGHMMCTDVIFRLLNLAKNYNEYFKQERSMLRAKIPALLTVTMETKLNIKGDKFLCYGKRPPTRIVRSTEKQVCRLCTSHEKADVIEHVHSLLTKIYQNVTPSHHLVWVDILNVECSFIDDERVHYDINYHKAYIPLWVRTMLVPGSDDRTL